MPNQQFVFDEVELTQALRHLFDADDAQALARDWMERFPADERGSLEGKYFEEVDFWRNEYIGPSDVRPSEVLDRGGLSDDFLRLDRTARVEFVLSDSGSFVLDLVSTVSQSAWERIREARGWSDEFAHRATAWMHWWLADFRARRPPPDSR